MDRCRRAHSPPPNFGGFDPRMMDSNNIPRIDHRQPGPHDFYDDLNFENHSYDLSPPTSVGRSNMIGLGPNLEPPPSMHHQVPLNYRENQRLPSTYRATLRGDSNYQMASTALSPGTYKILCLTNINPKISDGAVKEALMSDFSRFGDIQVSTCHDSGERLAYIYFRSYEEAREARHARARSMLFDRLMEIEPIYESGASPSDSPPQQPIYPRRRSATPPDYYGVNGRSNTRRPGPIPQHPVQYHEPPSPGMYPSSRFNQANAPPPMPANPNSYARTSGVYYPPQPPPMGVPHSPYSPPPPDLTFRSSYHQPHLPHPPHLSSPHMHQSELMQYQATPPATHDRTRNINEGPFLTRSPRNDFNQVEYMRDRAGPYQIRPGREPGSYYPMAASNLSPSPRRSSPPPAPNPPQPEYPRHMSREYRREKFGREHYNIEPEEGRPSRVIFVTNIDSSKTGDDLRDVFAQFGTIEEIDIRNVNLDMTSALVRYSSMDCAYRAKTAINGKTLGHLKCRISYGKVSATKRLWVGGFGPATKFAHLEDEFGKYGNITSMDYISGRPYAYVEYETPNQAQFAVLHLKGTFAAHAERKLRMEYVEPTETNDRAQRYDTSMHSSDKSRITNESWTGNELDSSLTGASKRSASPQPDDDLKRHNHSKSGTDHGNCSPVGVHGARYSGIGHISTPPELDEITAPTNAVRDELNNNKLIKNNGDQTASTIPNSDRNNSVEEDTRKYRHDSQRENSRDFADVRVTSSPLGTGHNTSALSGVSDRLEAIGEPPEYLDYEGLIKSRSISDVIECCGLSWYGQLVLKNFSFPTSMFLCGGKRATIEKYIIKLDERGKGYQDQWPILRINQRWRLHPQPKLEEVKRRMQSGNVAMLIITSRFGDNKLPSSTSGERSLNGSELTPNEELSIKFCPQENGADRSTRDPDSPDTKKSPPKVIDGVETEGNGILRTTVNHNPESSAVVKPAYCGGPLLQEGSATQPRPLKNLISYLEQKDAAGVICLNAHDGLDTPANCPSQESTGKLLYAFPPGDFAINLLKKRMPNLSHQDIRREEFLLGVIVGGSEGRMM